MATRVPAEVRAFIVQACACYDPPTAVAEAVSKEFGVTVTRQYVEQHDPTKQAGKGLGKKLCKLFDDTREKFLADTSDIAISHKPVRLRALQRMAQKAEGQGNMVLAASLYEQAAKEVGEAYTNRQKMEHTSPDGSMSSKPSTIELVAPDVNSKT